MKGLKKHRYGMLAVIMLAVCLVFPSYGTKTEVEDAKKKVDSLEEEKKKVEAAIKNLESLKSDTAAYVKQLDANLEALQQELLVLEGQIAVKEADIATAQRELEEARKVEEHQYESMKLRIKYMYERGETSNIDILLQSEDLSDLLNSVEYISKIAEYDRKMLVQYQDVKNDIVSRELVLQEEHAALLELQNATLAKQASVEQLMEEKTKELKNYETKIASAEAELTEYEKDIQAQENRIKQIEAEIKRKEEEARKAAEEAGKKYNTVNIGDISFIWPCPSSKRITSQFGDRESPTEGASSNHQAIDIGAASGSNILAAASGEVIISTYSYSAGNYVMINHGGGVYTVYMHCSSLLVSQGDKVTQGQVIAKVGSTGYSTGPHLHFGIRVNGSYVNPLNYVSP